MQIYVYNIGRGGMIVPMKIYVREACLLDAHRRAEKWVANDPDASRMKYGAHFSHEVDDGEDFPGDEPATFMRVQRFEKVD